MKKILIFAIQVLIISSCKKSELEVIDNAVSPVTLDNNLYAVGYESNLEGQASKVWNKGTGTRLNIGTSITDATKVFILGNDIFVSGFESYPLGKLRATVWKNGSVLYKSDSITNNNSEANSVYVAGSDVYSCGFFESRAAVWKNGIIRKLTPDSIISAANDVFVLGNDAYVAGWRSRGFLNSNPIAVYWKNGLETNLSNNIYSSTATNIFVSGNNVYLCGITSNGIINKATFWKNGVQTLLSNRSYSTGALNMFLSGNDVYIAGYSYDGNIYNALLWKNGEEQTLSNKNSAASSVVINGNDVYVAGTIMGSATVWKNGNPIKLATNEIPNSSNSWVNSIFIKN